MEGLAKQRWQPLGQLVEPRSARGWWASHASYPTAHVRADGLVTIFFSVRDAHNRSALAAVEVMIEGDRVELAGPVRGPLFEPGPRGAFDADGVTVTSVLRDGDRLLAYYLGWTVGGSVPFTNFIGLAVADADAAHFERVSAAPIVGRSPENPFTVGYPWVLRRGEGFHMWFGSHLRWGPTGLEMSHVLKEAHSIDGITWTPDPRIVVPLAGTSDAAEFALSRPVVIAERGRQLSMWYACRRPRYALGFASSIDGGATWQRDDRAICFLGKPEAWESEERSYPCVFDHRGRRYMLYNGNGYGRTGFGVALLSF
jgi:hypothetical protein